MLQIAICDDELFYREKLENLLKQYLHKKELCCSISAFSSGEEFLERYADRIKYDIVFLDISMEKLDGVQTAKQIRAFHSDTAIVFVTAFIDYALEGYKVDAVRYILKDTMDQAVTECMDAILHRKKTARVAFSFMEGEKKLYTDNILYIESRKHKSVFFYMENDLVSYQIYEKLDVIEEKLSECGFLRIHKSYLVNMKHIRKINHYTASLDCGTELPVPRMKYQAVKEAFAAYKGAM